MYTDHGESHDHEQDEFRQRSSNFMKWFTAHATYLSPKIELADLRDQLAGRGVVAKQDIEDNEELFSIPRSAILTPANSSIPHDLISELDNPWHQLILVMVLEHSLGAASKWKPYLDVLPEQFDTLMFWNQEELDNLRGSAVVDKIGKQSAEHDFRTILMPIIRQVPDSYTVKHLNDDDLIRLCHRMGSTIMAYAFDVEQPSNEQEESDGWEVASDDEESVLPVGMIPMADMLNADADRNNAKLYYEEDRVCMRSIKPVRQGEELFNDYGPIPQADLLRRYGYVTSNYAQYDVVEIDQAIVLEAFSSVYRELTSKEIDRRLTFLDQCGISLEDFDISHENEHGPSLSEQLVVTLKILASSGAEFKDLYSTRKLPATALQELNQRQLNVLSDIVLRRRGQYAPQSLAQDSSDLAALECDRRIQSSSTVRRKAMALQVITGEKQVLQAAFERVQSLLQHTGQKRKMIDFEEAASAKKRKE